LSVRRARRESDNIVTGFIVTWDADSRDESLCARVRRFVYGYTTAVNGKSYHHPGFVDLDGVCYLGQSVLCVTAERLPGLRSFLRSAKVNHMVRFGSTGAVLRD